MRLLLILFAVSVVAAAAPAQEGPLRVLRHAPGDTASSGNLVTVTFDRPAAGRLDATVSAASVFRIEPSVAGQVHWRDPITVRFVPDEPLPPGTRYRVTIDTTFIAIDGSKLRRPYEFTFRVPGPRLLVRSFGAGHSGGLSQLPVDGRIQLLYSAPVDLDELQRGIRLELRGCANQRTPLLRVTRQRGVAEDDSYRIRYAGGWDRDTTADRFRRVVELEPTDSLPPGCSGLLVLPTTVDDAAHGAEEAFAVETAPRFRIADMNCVRTACSTRHLRLEFTTPVKRADLLRHVRLEPAAPLVLAEQWEQTAEWDIQIDLKPRTTYTVIIDPALRDIHGRSIEPPHRLRVVTGDHYPALGWARGSITVPRSGTGTLPVRHVNVAELRVISYEVPADRRSAALAVSPFVLRDQLKGLRADTTLVRLAGALNVERSTELPLPRGQQGGPGRMIALRLEIASPLERPNASRDSGATVSQRPLRVIGESRDSYGAEFALIQISDLTVNAKPGSREATVLVTGPGNDRAVPRAVVRMIDINGAAIGQAATDSTGVATLEYRAAPAAARTARPLDHQWPPRLRQIEVTSGDDRLVLTFGVRTIGFREINPLNPASLGARTGTAPAATATIFADRGIYRPGEMVFLKGIVRSGDLGTLRIDAGRPVRLTIERTGVEWNEEDGLLLRDTVLLSNAFGTVTDSLRIPATARLGRYVAELHVGGPDDWHSVARETIVLGEYRPPEFLVETRADSAPRYGGDTVIVSASARYLFDAPMRNAAVSWNAELREVAPWELRIPGAEGWAVGVWDWRRWNDRRSASSVRGVDSLDAGGRLELRVPVGDLGASRPGRMDVHVAVSDVNKQVVTSMVSVPIHPARLYVLAKRRGRAWYWPVGQPATVDIRTVDTEGRDVHDVAVTIDVVRREWQRSGDDGRWVDVGVRTDTVRIGSQLASYTFTPEAGGSYDLRMSAPDGHGGTALTTLRGYAIASGQGWWARNEYHLPLVLSSSTVSAGEEVQVAFDSPFDDAEAWVTVERERVLEQRLVRVRGGTNIVPITISELHVPNVFVAVLLLRRGDPYVRADSASHLIRTGYAELEVNSSPKRLFLTVAPRSSEYAPGDSVAIDLRVTDAAGMATRTEVTLWAVDEGVLALTGFETPDPLARMYARGGLGAELRSTVPTLLTNDPDIRLWLERQMIRLAGASAGMSLSEVVVTGGESGSLPRMRTDFRSTAFFIGSTVTGSDGLGTASARLPDNLTTYRIMAVAVANDRFGHADSTLIVTRPLLIRPSLPRFVRASDTLVTGGTVNARDGSVRAVTVEVEAEGIQLNGARSQDLTLAAGRGGEARFSMLMPAREAAPDSIVVRLAVSDGSQGDAAETRLPVRPDFQRRVHTRFGIVRNETEVVFQLPADIDAFRSQLTLRTGTSSLAPMLAAYDQLRVYPYHCTEQIASRGLALIAVWRATRDRDPAALGGDPRAHLQQLADELTRRQRSDGAFRFWIDHPWTTPWLTAYAGIFLLEARADGISVDSLTLSRAEVHLSKAIETHADTGGMNRFERLSNRLALGDRVAVVDFLSRLGRPAPEAEDGLLRLATGMTWEDRLRLAEVIVRREDRAGDARGLLDAAWRATRISGGRVDLPDSAHAERLFLSRVAPSARLLTATLAIQPGHELIGGLIETVLQHGRAERGFAWSTQDYAAVVIALAPFSSAPSERTLRVRAGGRDLLSGQRSGSTRADTVPLTGILERGRDGRYTLRVRLTASRGSTPVHYALSVAEVPSKPPVTPDIQGIVVERWYERFDDGRPVTSVKEGDLVRVRLRVTVPSDRQFVAVEDPLPAGLEIVDVSLRTSGTLRPFATIDSDEAELRGDRDRDGPRWQAWLYGSWEGGWWSPWEHKALHDDKVVYFARMLWTGSYTASYIARATTAGTFVRPPAHAEEMYNPATQGRSDGGRFEVEPAPTLSYRPR